MKVKELPFLRSKDLQKLRDVAEMDITEYLIFIDKKKDEGSRINKPYQDLYDNIWAQTPSPLTHSHNADPIEKGLESVPIDELKFYYPKDTYIVDRLKTNGIVNLGQLYGIFTRKTGGFNHIGPAALLKIRSIKEAISKNPQKYIDEWHNSLMIHKLPSQYDRNLGLQINIKNAIIEYAQVIEDNINNPRYINSSQQRRSYTLLAFTLKQFYLNNQSCDQIAQKEGYTRQHIEILKANCISKIVSGTTLFNNYRIDQRILDLIQSLKEECLFDPISKFEAFSDSLDTCFFSDLGFDTLEIKDVNLLIPKGTKGLYETVWKVIHKILKENPLPTDRDVMCQLVINNKELTNIDYDPLFVEKILSCDSFVEDKGNHLIQIKDEYLTSAAQRFARLIYEADTKLSTDEAKRRYETIYKITPTSGLNNAGKYGVCCEGRKFWYYGEPKVPLQQKVTIFAENNKIFFYNEIEQAIKNDGYTIPQAFRVYITNVCAVDNKDKNHFCHKDYVDDYPDYSWRNPTKYGWTNWIFNEIKNILLEKKSVPLQKMIDELEKKSYATDYSSIRQRIQYNQMADFCGDGKPFIVKDGNVVVNQPEYDKTIFETIGLRGKYAYYEQIRSLVANEAKKAEYGKISLTDIINLVHETIDESLSRNVIIRAIEDEKHRFTPIDVELIKNEKGTLYAQWTKQETIPEPIYTINSVDDITEEENIIEVKQTESRPSIKYRQNVNKHELNRKLKNELSFFGRWMQYENYDINVAIDSFLNFIFNSRNSNLNKQLPLDLYEYWFAQTDTYDRYRYLKDIILDFEAVLGDLYYYQHEEKPNTKGLGELATFFPGLPNMLLYSRDNKGFTRVANELLRHRNKVAHGEDLQLNSLETAKCIIEYVALLVYVVAKYYQP